MTFSITARCPTSGAFGVAISSSSIAVTSRCAWPGPLGVVTSQNLTNPAIGTAGQHLLHQGLSAGAVLRTILAGDPAPHWRQAAVIDRYGAVATHDGGNAFPQSSVSIGVSVVAMGNLLAHAHVTQAMVDQYAATPDAPFAERLVRALEAGLAAGGEAAPVKAAGLKVSRQFDWPVVDLRVDWADEPIRHLRELWDRYRPLEPDFVSWASDPDTAAAEIAIRPHPE